MNLRIFTDNNVLPIDTFDEIIILSFLDVLKKMDIFYFELLL